MRQSRGSKFKCRCATFKGFKGSFSASLRKRPCGSSASADLISEGYRGCEANGIEWRACHDNGLASFGKRLQAMGEQHCPLVIHTAERVIDDDAALLGSRFLVVEHLERIGESLRQLLGHIGHQPSQPLSRTQRNGFTLERDIAPLQRPQTQQRPHQQGFSTAMHTRQTSHLACWCYE